MQLTERFKTRGYVDRKGLFDGLAGGERLFDPGFCRVYDTAYHAGERLRLHEARNATKPSNSNVSLN